MGMLLRHAAGGAPVPQLFAEDAFACTTYTGNGSTQTITNGIDLAGKGGLVWIKNRNDTYQHKLFDTVRGATKYLDTVNTNGEATYAQGLTAFNSTGFTLGTEANVNLNTYTYAAWTFAQAPKFFDVVTFTPTTDANYRVSHSLGVTPGVVIVKNLSAGNWSVYHRSTGRGAFLYLNTTAAQDTSETNYWGTADPTATDFGVRVSGAGIRPCEGGQTYVAYLFAHDTAADGIIQAGSFTTDGSGNATVNLGWEPQYLLVKGAVGAGGGSDWYLFDSMRGFPAGNQRRLMANRSYAEDESAVAQPRSTGFVVTDQNSSSSYIYLAIRRPNKTPTSGTEVFATATRQATQPSFVSGFPVDMVLYRYVSAVNNNSSYSRLLGNKELFTNLTNAEATYGGTTLAFDYNTGYAREIGADTASVSWMFRRAPGFFDVVCYTGTGTSGRAINHSLLAAPEFIIVKNRSNVDSWQVLHTPGNRVANLDSVSSGAVWSGAAYGYFDNGTTSVPPTASAFTVGGNSRVNASGNTYVAYLFASLPGISKVGSYTGNGSSQTINCGFSAGARFILIKRTDSTGDWFVWDTVRGIVAGNDPHLSLNTTAAEVTTDDSIDPDNSGFIVNQLSATNINVTSASYVFLAIA